MWFLLWGISTPYDDLRGTGEIHVWSVSSVYLRFGGSLWFHLKTAEYLAGGCFYRITYMELSWPQSARIVVMRVDGCDGVVIFLLIGEEGKVREVFRTGSANDTLLVSWGMVGMAKAFEVLRRDVSCWHSCCEYWCHATQEGGRGRVLVEHQHCFVDGDEFDGKRVPQKEQFCSPILAFDMLENLLSNGVGGRFAVFKKEEC